MPIRSIVLALLVLAPLACRRSEPHALAQPESEGPPAPSVAEQSLAQQDAIIRQQDVIIAQQGELLVELRALRDQLGRGGDVDAGPPARGGRPAARAGQPDPAATYKVPIDGAQARGPADAKVTIVEWADFQCPFCSRVDPVMAELLKDYEGDLRHVYMHNALPMHDRALPAALAAEAAGRQGKFWQMYALMFEHQKELSDENFAKWAKKLKLDTKRFKRDMKDPQLAEHIGQQQQLATSLGARGTPAFFVNGRFLSGAQPKDAFKVLIDEELAKADRLIASGTPRARLYEVIVADGRTAP